MFVANPRLHEVGRITDSGDPFVTPADQLEERKRP